MEGREEILEDQIRIKGKKYNNFVNYGEYKVENTILKVQQQRITTIKVLQVNKSKIISKRIVDQI